MKKILPHIFFLLWSFCATSFAQFSELEFLKLNTDEGLSQSVIHSLEKDHQGRIWVGTQDGLNRFDGYNFEKFYNKDNKTGQLKHSYVWTLHISDENTVWIGTNGGGLYRFDDRVQLFTQFAVPDSLCQSARSNNIRAIHSLSHSELLIGTDDGLYLFNSSALSFKRISHKLLGSIFAIHRLSDTDILLGSLEHIFHYHTKKKYLKLLSLNEKIEGGIHCFASNEHSEFWLGSGKGLYLIKLNIEMDSLQILNHYFHNEEDLNSLSNNSIADLLLKGNELWIATNKGLNFLNLLDTKSGFKIFNHDKEKTLSISSDIIYCLQEVERNTLWAGTQDGLNQFSVQKSDFINLHLDQQTTTCGQSLHGMLEMDNHILACSEKGLMLIDLETGKVDSCFINNNYSAIADDFLVSVSKGGKDNYWIALRRNGFVELKKKDNTFEFSNFKLPAGPYESIGTNDLIEDDAGNLWIASSGLGLWFWNRQTNNFISYKSNEDDTASISGNYIFHLFEDSNKNLWVSTADGGLNCFDRNTNSFKAYRFDEKDSRSISANMVLSVFEDQKNRIWACTVNGLNLWDGQDGFIRFDRNDGLPNNVIYGMLEDKNGGLWLSTGNGLANINYDGDNFKTKNYSSTNGLLNNEFNQHAFLKLKSGHLAFGTKGGLTYVHPDSIKNYDLAPHILLTDFKLFNESVPINESKSFSIQQHIDKLENLVLSYDQNFLAFEFTGINYEQIQANRYAYFMEGLDEDWVYSENRRFANYPGMKPGNYSFKVKAANYDGLWSEEKIINIQITNPPWKTWWAYILYLLAIGALVWYRIYSLKKIEEAKERARQHIRKRSAQDFHDEAGNQITKIALMAEMAKRQADKPELNQLMNEIGDQVQELRTGMRDFIWVLDPGKDNLYDTLIRLNDFGNSLFNYSNIHFSNSGITDSLKNYKLNAAQRRHLLMIFKEAMNNCVKYAKGTKAQLIVSKHENEINLRFEDDGIGYSSIGASEGYGLQNMKARAKKMNARLTISSDKSEGTTLSVFMDITQMGD